MKYGIDITVNGIDITYEPRPFNPVYTIRVKNLKTGKLTFDLPEGDGEVIYTSSKDRPFIDREFDMGGSWLGSLDSVSIVGNRVTMVFGKVDKGLDDLYLTFYRARP